MRLGIDLDNTIIRYDELFSRLAAERQLVPPHLASSKQAIRDYLRAQGQEDRWTDLQGIAYGSSIDEAAPFTGVEDFLDRCTAAGVEWWIISHRTQRPYLGEPVDLHAAARNWLVKRGIVPAAQLERVKLEVDRRDKLRRIAEVGCDTFIDDLPELLADPDFPTTVRRILFDPGDQNPDCQHYTRATSWPQIAKLLGV